MFTYLFGGAIADAFVHPETMPAGVAAAVDVNPVTHLISAVRG